MVVPLLSPFDQPLRAASVDAFRLTPELDGQVAVADTTLTFTPADAPTPGQRYRFTIDTRARSEIGIPLSAPVEITLAAAVPVRVTSTQPSDGAVDVSTQGQIVVVFNRPVVELVGVDAQADLPDPLRIAPPVEGEGAWLNTSIYTFRPARGLAGATEYTVMVGDITGSNGVVDNVIDDAAVVEPHIFTFTTADPTVIEITPTGEQVRPDTSVTVAFSQPMDRASTEDAFVLFNVAESSTAVAGAFGWNGASTTLTFTPTERLTFGADYGVEISADAQPASLQGNLREAANAEFFVVPLPAVANTTPGDGDRRCSA